MAVIQNMKDDSETKLLKKLVTNWIAEAEPKDEALDYDKVEAIIEAYVDGDDKTLSKLADNSNDLAMALQAMFGKGRRGGDKGGKGNKKLRPCVATKTGAKAGTSNGDRGRAADEIEAATRVAGGARRTRRRRAVYPLRMH